MSVYYDENLECFCKLYYLDITKDCRSETVSEDCMVDFKK